MSDATSAIQLDGSALRTLGRRLEPPFHVMLLWDGQLTRCVGDRVLRMLPAKRLVFRAQVNDRSIVVKVFLDKERARTHFQREQRGLAAFHSAQIPCPNVLAYGQLDAGEPWLAVEYLARAESLADVWRHGSPGVRHRYLTQLVRLVAKMNEAGLRQTDLHFDNFMLHHGKLVAVDGGGVRVAKKALEQSKSLDTLALLHAQLPLAEDVRAPFTQRIYCEARGWPANTFSAEALALRIRILRRERMDTYARKSVRDCTEFVRKRGFNRLTLCLRSAYDALQPMLQDPEIAMTRGQPVKLGNTASVVRVTVHAAPTRSAAPTRFAADMGTAPEPRFDVLAVKRYNIKNWRHALARGWRRSRGEHAWEYGNRLKTLGIATPEPVALVVETLGWWRRRAWLFTTWSEGQTLAARTAATEKLSDADLNDLETLLQSLAGYHLTHGDMKASNFLCTADALLLLDLDGMRQHRSRFRFARRWKRDFLRLLANWPANAALAARLNVTVGADAEAAIVDGACAPDAADGLLALGHPEESPPRSPRPRQ